MTVKTGGAWAGTFVTLSATGALAAGTPSGVLYVDGVADGATVTISGSNPYKWAVTLPSLTAGQRVDMYITATISTIATAAVVASEQADTALTSEVKTDTAAILADTGTDGVVLKAAGLDTDAVTEIQSGLATAAALTTIDDFLDTEVAAILADTNELQTDLVNGGRLDLLIDAIKAKTDVIPASPAAVGSAMTLANGAITAAVIATGAIDADAIADNAIDAGAIATGAITNAKFAAGAIDAAAIATDAIDADAIKADAVTEIQTGITATVDAADIRSAIGLATANLDTQLSAINSKTTNLPASPANEATLTAMKGAGWVDESLESIQAMNGIGFTIVVGDVGEIKAKTDQLTFTTPNQVDANALSGGGGAGTGDTSWTYTLSETDLTPIADATVWVTSDIAGASILAAGTTDASGQVTFLLNAGATVYVWAKKFGWTFTNPDTEMVA